MLGHCVEKLKQAGFDHQLMGREAFAPVGDEGQDRGRGGLAEGGARRMKALHGPLAVDKGKDIFFVAGVSRRALKEGGGKEDVEILTLRRTGLVNGVDRVGQNHQQVPGAKGVGLPPQRGGQPAPVAVDELKALVPVQGEGGEPLGNAPVVDAVGEGGASVYFGFMQVRAVHKDLPKIGLC